MQVLNPEKYNLQPCLFLKAFSYIKSTLRMLFVHMIRSYFQDIEGYVKPTSLLDKLESTAVYIPLVVT